MVLINDFLPYFYIRTPDGFVPQQCEVFQASLEVIMIRQAIYCKIS
jgi:hypothetical protein